jgi:hypothetical protein
LLRRLLTISALAIALQVCLASSAGAQLVAERITNANFATHHVGGPDADAGVDDWFMSNGMICAVISDPEHESPLAPKGGVLIDLGHCGRANDQWAVLQPMMNLSQAHVVPVTEISAGTTTGEAWIRTRALFAGVEVVTTYSLSLSEPTALRVSTEAKRLEPGDSLFSIGTILMHTSGQTRPFSLLRKRPEASIGFEYPPSDRRSLFSLVNALVASDLNILVGAEGMPSISYGIEQLGASVSAEDRTTESLRTFVVTGLHFTAFNTLTRPAWFGDSGDPPSVLDLARIPFIDLEARTLLQNESRIWVGDRSDVSSITNQIWRNAPLVRGRVDDPTAQIHIDSASGAPTSVVRPQPDGSFELRLPAGQYRAQAHATGDRDASAEFEVNDASAVQRIPSLEVGTPAWITFPKNFVGRLTFLDATTGEPLVFGDDLLGFRIGDDPIPSAHEANYVNLAGVDEDPDRLAIAPGDYRVIAVRGIEYAAQELAIEARAGQSLRLDLAPLERLAKTPGWLAADLHVHSGESFDSGLPATRQIAAFAASGAEVLVATEHDRIVDPGPALRATGLTKELVVVNGVEMTSAFEGADSPYATGHWNAFPVIHRPRTYRGGAPNLEGRRARDAIADIRGLESKPFLQLNHPRTGIDGAEGDTYFQHLGVAGIPFDPTLSLEEAPNAVLMEKGKGHGMRDADYDGVELLNGPDMLRYRRTRADWFSMLLQGESRVATSNSDSHRLGVIVGLPRTYVEIRDDALASFDESSFMGALSAGRAYGSTGPLLSVRLDDSSLGDLHSGNTGLLEVSVDAAPWIPVREWRAYVNGELVHRAPIAPGQKAQLPLAFERDAFVTVEVEGPIEGRYAEALPDFTPFAFTNPIFVDVDGNGKFDAPGLPAILPSTLTDPDRPD